MRALRLIPLLSLSLALSSAEGGRTPGETPTPPAPRPPALDWRSNNFWYDRTTPEPFPRYPITHGPVYVNPPSTTYDAWRQEELSQQQWSNQQERLREGNRQSDEFHRKLEQERERVRSEAH